jgi:regulator of protease activity HflC (stomatin/prohibitin superfamily)
MKMKKNFLFIAISMAIAFASISCSKVPAGNVGIKVHLLGNSKGVDSEELGPGRYWIGINEELFIFPTFTQNYVWTKSETEGSPDDESITFQTKEGMRVNADIGISYRIKQDKINFIFQKYRKGVDEITSIYLRNAVRDALNMIGSTVRVEDVYGNGKSLLIKKVEDSVREYCSDIGIIVEKIYLVGEMRLPSVVLTALNKKIEATQRAEQRENELRETEAEAKKKVAEATGEANAILARATAQAKANTILSKSITQDLVKYEAIKRWDGELPGIVGSDAVIPMVNIK